MMKSLLISSFAISISYGIITTPVQGQNMQAVNALLSQNHMHQQMQMNLMRVNMAKGSTVLHYPKANYRVLLKDSTLTEVKSKIMFDERNISYLEA